MYGPRLQSVSTEMEAMKPLGDFVLVKPLPIDDPLSRLWLPISVKRTIMQLKLGLVVAAGDGDRLITLRCKACGTERSRLAQLGFTHAEHLRAPIKTSRCSCGESAVDLVGETRAAMNVQVGDEIIYWRSPANDCFINGVEYVFLHEEQHIVAVVDKEENDVSTLVA
jgi:hypothetical protein